MTLENCYQLVGPLSFLLVQVCPSRCLQVLYLGDHRINSACLAVQGKYVVVNEKLTSFVLVL